MPNPYEVSQPDFAVEKHRALHNAISLNAWIPWTPTIVADGGGFSLGGAGSAARGRYMRIGRTVIGTAELILGAGATQGSGFYQLRAPFPSFNFSPQINATVGSLFLVESSVNDFRAGLVSLDGGGPSWFRGIYSAVVGIVGAGAPWTWNSGDKIIYNFTYEAAS